MPPDLLSRALKRCGCLFCFALVQKLYVYFTTDAAATSQMPRPNDYYLREGFSLCVLDSCAKICEACFKAASRAATPGAEAGAYAASSAGSGGAGLVTVAFKIPAPMMLSSKL